LLFGICIGYATGVNTRYCRATAALIRIGRGRLRHHQDLSSYGLTDDPVRRSFSIILGRFWNTGSLSRAMTAERGALLFLKRKFAFPRRDAPEVCMNLPPNRGRGECRAPNAPAASRAK